jgi:NTE family protein
MLYALVESGIRPGMIVGTSIGAINGALLAGRADLEGVAEIADLWSSLRRRDVLGVSAPTLLRGLLGRRGPLFDSLPMRRVVESFLNFSRLEDAPVPLAVVATALITGEPVVLDSGDATTALLASSAVPGILPPVEIGGRMLVDGSGAADVPLRQAVSLGARDLYVLPTAPKQIETLLEQSPGCGTTDRPGRPTVRILAPPDVHIPFGDLGQSARLLELGYERARAWIEGKPVGSAPKRRSPTLPVPLPRRRPRRADRPPACGCGDETALSRGLPAGRRR